jgi:signal transduction histidine kinase
MNAPFLCGTIAAWAAAQVALGIFFALVYALGRRAGRREPEYLLFGMLCFALAATSAGLAWGYAISDAESWQRSMVLGHAGAIACAAVGLHLGFSYSGIAAPRRLLPASYAVAVLFEGLNLAGLWWTPGTVKVIDSQVWGYTVRHFSAQPGPVAIAFYLFATAVLLGCCALLARSVRAGRPEALLALAGAIVAAVAAGNDMLLMTGVMQNTLYLLPHGALLLAFCVASTLILRYQKAAGALAKTESVLAHATEELRHSHAELLSVQTELNTKQQLAAVGELAAAIAHEVRNPLAVIFNAVAGLRRSGLREEDRMMLLGIVDEETARLNRLVTDLLRFARPVAVRAALVSLPELAHRSESVTKQDHSIEVSVDDPEVQTVQVDPGLFRLVFDNLVENACQAMPGGGVVHVRVQRGMLNREECARVSISDTGHGMDAEILQRATHPFFTTRPSGTGLGLPIVQRIVEAHGASIKIESVPSVGTTVELSIPLRLPDHVEIYESGSMAVERRTA